MSLSSCPAATRVLRIPRVRRRRFFCLTQTRIVNPHSPNPDRLLRPPPTLLGHHLRWRQRQPPRLPSRSWSVGLPRSPSPPGAAHGPARGRHPVTPVGARLSSAVLGSAGGARQTCPAPLPGREPPTWRQSWPPPRRSQHGLIRSLCHWPVSSNSSSAKYGIRSPHP